MTSTVASPLGAFDTTSVGTGGHDTLAARHRRRGFFDVAMADSPWRVADFVRASARLSSGLIAIGVAWAGASGTVVWRDQLLWTAVGIGGVVLSATGVFMWLLSGLGMVSRERRCIRQLLLTRHTHVLNARPSGPSDRNDAETVLSGPGMRRYHIAGCDAVRGKNVTAFRRDQCGRLGLTACGMCES